MLGQPVGLFGPIGGLDGHRPGAAVKLVT